MAKAESHAQGSLSSCVNDVIRTGRSISKTCVNNAKVSDHHAIIPTEQAPDFSSFNTDEKRIYLLVAMRFLSCFLEDYTYRQVKAELTCGAEKFYVTGNTEIDAGWKKISIVSDDDDEQETAENEKAEEQKNLPDVKKGDVFTCTDTLIKSLKTTPPSRYTEASLLAAMENPSRFITDRGMKSYIGGGLALRQQGRILLRSCIRHFILRKRIMLYIRRQKEYR